MALRQRGLDRELIKQNKPIWELFHTTLTLTASCGYYTILVLPDTNAKQD